MLLWYFWLIAQKSSLNFEALQIISDAWFVSGIIGSVKNHSQTSPYPIYLYKLSLDTHLNFVKRACQLTAVSGKSYLTCGALITNRAFRLFARWWHRLLIQNSTHAPNCAIQHRRCDFTAFCSPLGQLCQVGKSNPGCIGISAELETCHDTSIEHFTYFQRFDDGS